MDRQELKRQNEALMTKRAELGIGEKPVAVEAAPQEVAFLEQILNSAASGPPSHQISGSRELWDSFNSDIHPALIKAVKAIKHWYNEGIPAGRTLVLAGGYGCGKTHLAAAIHQMYSIHSVMYEETELFKTIQASFDRHSGETEQGIMMRVIRSRLFVFDDLGSYETNNLAWIQNIYRAIFDGRCDKGKPCLITTNTPLDQLIDRIGGRNLDRLCGALETDYYIDLFDVPSYRMRHLRKAMGQ